MTLVKAGSLWREESGDAYLYLNGSRVAKIDSNGILSVKAVRQVRSL